jgi:hypothetical protein
MAAFAATMMKILLSFIFFAIYTSAGFPQSKRVVINEFLATNSSINNDPDFGLYSDWIELYNPGNDKVDLSAWYLTDDLSIPSKWQIPEKTQIAPGEFLIFWADGKNADLIDYHTDFNLSQSGEEIGLFDVDFALIDKIVYEKQTTDISFGRQPDCGENWYFFDRPTPGGTNNSPIHNKTNPPRFSLPAGFYTEDRFLEISTDDPSATVRYTTDGNEPTETSPAYSVPLMVKSRVGEPNVFAEIRTNADPYLWLPDWEPPNGEVFKVTVIRARVFKTGFHPSEIVSKTYFVGANIKKRYPTVPVISLISDYKHLFDDITGIYVPGIYHRTGDSGSGNYFRDWEKPAHIEFFEPGGELGFSQDVGIRIQGGSSPASPQKGLHVIARSEYGSNRIEYPIFANDPSQARHLTEFKRFIIRAWGSLITGSLFNDAYAHRLMAKGEIDIQAYRPAVVFINGEYWGLHALREANKNSWYYQYHYDIDREYPGFDILEHSFRNGRPYPYVDEGDAENWNAMIEFLNTHDMRSSDNYEYIKTQIDIDNFITYLGHCIYVGKWDWPNNNDASWRPRTEDGRWRWIQYDMETGFGVATQLGPEYAMLGPQLNMLKAAVEGIDIPGFGRYGPHPVLEKLYVNDEFKDSFMDWFSEHMDCEFMPDSMNCLLEDMAAEIRPYMREYKDRWPFIGDVDSEWANSLEQIKGYNEIRPVYMRKHLLEQNIAGEKTPVEYRLYQNFPNPFNSLTIISFSIAARQRVRLSIYNTLGQEIDIPVDEMLSAGHHTLRWNAENRPSGLYMYRLQSDHYSETGKMVLLR